MMSKVLDRNISDFATNFALKTDLHDTSFLITGATGLIGSTLIRCLVALKENIRIIAPVRNLQKASTMLGDIKGVKFIECDITAYDYDRLGDINYIVHCAAPTASKYFIEHPAETIDVIYKGTKVLLDYANNHPVRGFVYLSSLEVYGTIHDDSKPVTEDVQGYLDPLSVRSSYPMAKRAAENLCVAYAREYQKPVKIARLTQTTGAGIAKDDNRIIAQFARFASQGEDIILHTTGEAARPYCYTIDTVSSILYILLKGNYGEAYNVANESTYISARGMAEYLKTHFCPNMQFRVELDDSYGYAPVTKLNLSSQKLQSLGWQPHYGLKEIFSNLIEYLKEE